MSESPWDPIPEGFLGSSPKVPYVVSPEEFGEYGLPYGAWCRCGRCGWVGRSTNAFDYYGPDGVGTPLVCENCLLGTPYATDILMAAALERKP